MKAPNAPRLDERRTADFSAELEERARAWIPTWGLADGEHDFGRALLEIAARFNSEVAERFDNVGEKMRRGFLDWLGERGEAAQPARMPVVFKMADTAREGVLASPPVRLQADADGTPVVFETEKEVRIIRGQLEVVVGIDAEKDAFYLPAPGLNDLKPLEPLPTEWQLKGFASAKATTLQLDPESGLLPDMIIEAGEQQYRVVEADKDLVTIEPPLAAGLSPGTTVTKITVFAPFDGRTRNQQEHVLYIGDSELLNLEDAARIDVVGAATLRTGVTWQYWGKVAKEDGDDKADWQDLTLADVQNEFDAVILTKPKGAIEPHPIAGKESRWIRCKTPTLAAKADLFSADALKLRINCLDDEPKCPQETAPTDDDSSEGDPKASGPAAEGMVNSTPLVLSEPFFPLGREPRLFDAFYLGSAEAFSKKDATAWICFEMSDATCLAYATVRQGPSAYRVLAGVGKDHALHLFKLNQVTGVMTVFRGSLRPVPPNQSAPLNLNIDCRPVMWNGDTNPDDLFIAVASGADIWIWNEIASDPKASTWKRHSGVPLSPGSLEEISDIIVLKSNSREPGAVLCGGRFYVFDGTVWDHDASLKNFVSLTPIYDGNLGLTDSMVAVGKDRILYELKGPIWGKTAIAGVEVDIGKTTSNPVFSVRPAAIEHSGQLHVVAVSKTRDSLVAVKRGFLAGTEQVISLGNDVEAIGAEIAIARIGGKRQFFVGARRAGGAFIASWIPTFLKNDASVLFESPIPDASGDVGGTPLIALFHIVVPGARGDAFVATFDPKQRLIFTKIIGDGVIVPLPAPFANNDFISVMPNPAGARMEWQVVNAPVDRGTETIYLQDKALGEHIASPPELIGYLDVANDLTGTVENGSSSLRFTPDSNDPLILEGDILRTTLLPAGPATFCTVTHVDANGVVEVDASTPLPASTGQIFYWKPKVVEGRTAPAIEFRPFPFENVDASMLERGSIYFPSPPGATLQPARQQGTAFGVSNLGQMLGGGSIPINHPAVVALRDPWTSTTLPSLTADTEFIIDAVIGSWKHQLADSSSNPALSWEYWNGKGWWSLEILADNTQRFAKTGTVKFKVPQDIAESDWAGKTNFWIRARLVGGDYGQEEVTVVSKPGSNAGETEQVVQRSTANIRAPLVLDLRLAYSICKEVFPLYVVAKDSGTLRDQSDANRTPGAIVEAFVPLALTLGRLTKTTAATGTTKSPTDCPPDCDCTSLHAGKAESADAAPIVTAPTTRVSGRELYIGLAATPTESPVNVLLLVKERPHSQFAPMRVEALVADRFNPIVAGDATRALGESGVLSMSFAVPPTRAELFGKENLTWLRLVPGSKETDEWLPMLRGAYLNAAWASATETLTRELLGSSTGVPNLVVRLARPPVLQGTLELRVKESLGEEEREKLTKIDPNNVLSAVEGLPGDWVLWKQVPDPDDEPATERVYALDEANGEIRFGDGRHGKIPPTGRNSIVAFTYGRTEPDPTGGESVPGNTIEARAALNLVSPVESVESVMAADHAAGGAPPESDDRVLRFGFARQRHRSRAVTAYDLEDLALQSSPDIAQARAFMRRGYVRLVVVMRGKNPLPNAAQIRELRRLLLKSAPVSLSAPNALRIEGPKIRRLRVSLELRVEGLDRTGELSASIKKKFVEFFDTATGGIDKDGWAMGLNPSEDDIAFALSDAPFLESIEKVTRLEITDDGNEHPWPEPPPRETEIVMLDDDPVRFEFETAEVMA